ncbi:MAG: hypothetical protein JSU62_10930 [Gammaproteobacteria bacterium]|nr:MAG: hypothetical protein JSU62_10930 [Gammaproteobacteria bacterium]
MAVLLRAAYLADASVGESRVPLALIIAVDGRYEIRRFFALVRRDHRPGVPN